MKLKMNEERFTFPYFNELTDELCVNILSFISSAPYEVSETSKYI